MGLTFCQRRVRDFSKVPFFVDYTKGEITLAAFSQAEKERQEITRTPAKKLEGKLCHYLNQKMIILRTTIKQMQV